MWRCFQSRILPHTTQYFGLASYTTWASDSPLFISFFLAIMISATFLTPAEIFCLTSSGILWLFAQALQQNLPEPNFLVIILPQHSHTCRSAIQAASASALRILLFLILA